MLLRWLRERRVRREEHHKQIFCYEFRGKRRYADPMAICLSLQIDKDYTPEHLRKAKQAQPLSMEIVADAATRAFAVTRLDTETGEGMTVAELVGLVDAFDLWCYQLQKKTPHLRT